MKATEKKYDRYELPATLALCAPAVRMVVIHAWAGTAGEGHATYPVLALIARQGYRYTREHDGTDAPRPATHRGLERAGWWHDEDPDCIDFDAVITDGDFGICEARTVFQVYMGGEHEIMACPWPAEEDETRLAPALERLKEKARQKAGGSS